MARAADAGTLPPGSVLLYSTVKLAPDAEPAGVRTAPAGLGRAVRRLQRSAAAAWIRQLNEDSFVDRALSIARPRPARSMPIF